MLSILMTFLNKRTGESDCRLYSCQNHINELFILEILGVGDLTFGGGGGGGDIPPPLLYETLMSLF